MKTLHPITLIALVLLSVQTGFPQTGPFSPEDWPTTRVDAKKVHYVATDGNFVAPGATWLPASLNILTDGDQVTQDITIGGHLGKKVAGNNLNIADLEFTEWADDPFIDILMQVYGDDALFNATGAPRNFNFLTGTLPELNAPNGGQIPVEAKNKKWNWVLFRIPNGLRPSDGSRFVGSIPANAQGAFTSGGVNGGTIRLQDVPGIIVRVIAWGEEGAFGDPADINKFFPADTCSPEPETNLAGIDVNAGITNRMVVLNDGDQTVTFATNIGPATDLRRAVRPDVAFINFGILSNYLGQPCNDTRAVKVCVDFYDDPAFAGLNVTFGPEAFATDDLGGTGTFPAVERHFMEGSGQWIRRSWVISAVNLKGINAGTLTAGPRFISENGQVFISRFELGVLRTGTNALAGIDPLADCHSDPNICTGVYGSFAELDLANGIQTGLAPGSSGGDQEMIQENAGPTNDVRMAIRPARNDGTPGSAHGFLNFAITGQALGPSSQPNAHLAICVTYYDDPALLGATFRPEVYKSDRGGLETFGFTPGSFNVAIQGTGQWRDAYWEITDMKFSGVNQGPQAAARFALSDKIFFSRVRYGVIRPCGTNAGVNPIIDCKPVFLGLARATNGVLRLAWPAESTNFVVQSTSTLIPPQWQTVTNLTPTVEGGSNVVTIPNTGTNAFYRLRSRP